MSKSKKVPELELTRAEFAQIPKVKSQAEIVALGETVERVAMRGDCGNQFVCYPKTKHVFVVKFVKPVSNRRQANVSTTGLLMAVVGEIKTLRERNHTPCQ